MKMKFRLNFVDENGSPFHEIISGEYQYVFAWLQGYLKGGEYALTSIRVVEELE